MPEFVSLVVILYEEIMQDLGYIKINGKNILVLYRSIKYGIELRIRKNSKTEGKYLKNESEYLKTQIGLIKKLKEGKIIKI